MITTLTVTHLLIPLRKLCNGLSLPSAPERLLSLQEYNELVASGNAPLIAPNINYDSPKTKMQNAMKQLAAIQGVSEVALGVCDDSEFPDEVSCDHVFVAGDTSCYNALRAWASMEEADGVWCLPGRYGPVYGMKKANTIYFIPWD